MVNFCSGGEKLLMGSTKLPGGWSNDRGKGQTCRGTNNIKGFTTNCIDWYVAHISISQFISMADAPFIICAFINPGINHGAILNSTPLELK